jgi:hypothetical protein
MGELKLNINIVIAADHASVSETGVAARRSEPDIMAGSALF